MKLSIVNTPLITLICLSLLLSSCGKDDPKPDDQSQGLRDRTFDLYVEDIRAFSWAEPRNEYEGVKAGDKIGTLSLTLAGDEANYWYDHRIDLEGDYKVKWEGKYYNPATLNVRTYRFDMLNSGLWEKQFTPEEEVLAISEEDMAIRVAVGTEPLNDAEATVFTYLRAVER